jgi:hypothetical protein
MAKKTPVSIVSLDLIQQNVHYTGEEDLFQMAKKPPVSIVSLDLIQQNVHCTGEEDLFQGEWVHISFLL